MHPVLLHLPFGLPLYGYGSMLLLSMLAGGWIAVRLGERDGIERGPALRCVAWTLLCALAGARLLFVLLNARGFPGVSEVVQLWRGGVVAYGGFLGGFLGAAAYCRRARIPFLTWADAATPGLCAGLALTRVGCLLAGCDFGVRWDGPWAVTFPAGSPAFREHVLEGLLPPGAASSLPVHPTQIYESLVGVALIALAVWLRRRRAFAGQVFLSVAVAYGVLRAALELLRADAAHGALGRLSTSQLIGLVTAAIAAACLRTLSRRQPRSPVGARAPRPEDALVAQGAPTGRERATGRGRRKAEDGLGQRVKVVT